MGRKKGVAVFEETAPDGFDPKNPYKDLVAMLEMREHLVQEKWIDIEKAKILRERLKWCYRVEGKVVRKDSAKKTAKKSRVKCYVKLVNFRQVIPTRYTLDVDLKDVVSTDALVSKDKKVAAEPGYWYC